VVTIHGCGNKRSASADVFVGGLDRDSRDGIISELRQAGFCVAVDRWTPGKATKNICNLGASGAGVQLEISRRLRDRLGKNENASLLRKFAKSGSARDRGSSASNERLRSSASVHEPVMFRFSADPMITPPAHRS
jgi:hypothetical protein